MDSPDDVMEAAERERSEERKTKKEEEEEEEDWKAYHARQEEIWAELDREAQSFRITKEPWESYRDWWNSVWGEDGFFGTFEDTSK
jgi:hypothetical protein